MVGGKSVSHNNNKAAIGQSLYYYYFNLFVLVRVLRICNNAEFIVAPSYVENCNEMHAIAVVDR